ncbi:MAG TPA: pentapeptide repeat-containing protein [Pyrinomonadaceae bacterium]|nr:pentapeptide repeat-containing protein [Pyrinomonadaceae bacterium]
MAEIRHKDTGSLIHDVKAATFAGANLNRRNLSHADMRQQNLRSANLEEANLSDAVFTDADLTQACLRGAKLRRANLSGAVLVGCDLRGADLRGANLNNASMRGADLQGADVVGASLRDVSIAGANFSGVKTRSAKVITFSGAPMTPIACPQEKVTSKCKECGQEALGRYFCFHYGVLTDYAEGPWGQAAAGMARQVSAKYRILGYCEVFLCERCIGKRWRRLMFFSPIIPLSWLAMILLVQFEPPMPSLMAAALVFVLIMTGFVGLLFIGAGLLAALRYYRFHDPSAGETLASSLVDLKEKGIKDKLRILDSDFYCSLD